MIDTKVIMDGIDSNKTTQLEWILDKDNYADIPNTLKDKADDIILINNINNGSIVATNDMMLSFFNQCKNYGGDVNHIEMHLINLFNNAIEIIYDASMELLKDEEPYRQNDIIEEYLPNYYFRCDVQELKLIERFNELHDELGYIPVYYGDDSDSDKFGYKDLELILTNLPIDTSPIEWAKHRESELRTILYNEAMEYSS